ncbi:MAG: hypothetical protein GX774_18445 [Armatimonadetes bacterium]|nr:hypothetical protein [Armatimonadota bacterium]
MSETIDLSGQWQFVPDLGAPSAEYATPGYDRSDWESVPVPGCWNRYRECYALYEGIGWYARRFHSPRSGPAWLRFDGANYETTPFLNGVALGTHRGGGAGFTFATGDALREGANELVVRVDNRRHRMHFPAVSGWFNYGGLHGDVRLLFTAPEPRPAPPPRTRLHAGRLEVKGRPVFLRGINSLPLHPTAGSVQHPDWIERDLELLQALHVNAIRCHLPPGDYLATRCDELGILVLPEAPVYCLNMPGYGDRAGAEGEVYRDPEALALAKQMLGEMIADLRHHRRILGWGIGNECDSWRPEARPFFQALADEARRLDPTRPVSYAALWFNPEDACYQIVDLLGINQYTGWNDLLDRPEEARRLDLSGLETKLAAACEQTRQPILLTEFGADAVPGYHAAERPLWSEEYQAELLCRTITLARRFPRIAGTFPFLFNDYPDPSKPVNGRWNGLNLKGVVTEQRDRKLAFDALAALYAQIEREDADAGQEGNQ